MQCSDQIYVNLWRIDHEHLSPTFWLENNVCFLKEQFSGVDLKEYTVPLSENFTGKCCTEHFGGKTCHIIAEKIIAVYGDILFTKRGKLWRH